MAGRRNVVAVLVVAGMVGAACAGTPTTGSSASPSILPASTSQAPTAAAPPSAPASATPRATPLAQVLPDGEFVGLATKVNQSEGTVAWQIQCGTTTAGAPTPTGTFVLTVSATSAEVESNPGDPAAGHVSDVPIGTWLSSSPQGAWDVDVTHGLASRIRSASAPSDHDPCPSQATATPPATPTVATLYVAPSGSGGGSCAAPDYTTIQSAVNAAAPGDTIRICAGTYDLSATLTVPTDKLTFQGAGAASTIIDGGGSVELFNVSAPTVAFSGLTFQHGSSTTQNGDGAILGFTVTVTNSTFTDNRADNGGAIGAGTVTNSTFTGNSASYGGAINGSGTVTNSILARAAGTNDCSDKLTDGGGNFSTDASCGFTQASSHNSVSFASLGLGSLAAHGGPTQTIAVSPGSVAIDAVPCTLKTDQRGDPRPDVDSPAETRCDAGAYESALAGSTP